MRELPGGAGCGGAGEGDDMNALRKMAPGMGMALLVAALWSGVKPDGTIVAAAPAVGIGDRPATCIGEVVRPGVMRRLWCRGFGLVSILYWKEEVSEPPSGGTTVVSPVRHRHLRPGRSRAARPWAVLELPPVLRKAAQGEAGGDEKWPAIPG